MIASRGFAAFLIFLYGVIESIRVTLTPAFFQQLTSDNYLHYSIEQYGLLFLPFSIAAFASSLFVGRIIERRGLFAPFLIAILCDLASIYFMGMAILANYSMVYSFVSLLVATFLSGVGFGIILTVVNTYISQSFPKKTEVFITGFYLSLSLGSLLLFASMDFALKHITVFMWILVSCFIAFYFLFNYFEIFPKTFVKEERPTTLHPWSLLSSLGLIGVLEALFFNWSLLYLEKIGGVDLFKTNQIYFTFLIFFTLGQIVFALLLYFTSFNFLFLLVPTVSVLILFLAFSLFSLENVFWLFGLIGCFLSCNLPFVMGYAKKMYGANPRIFGKCVAAYTFGFGISSYIFGLKFLPHFFLITIVIAALILFFNCMSVMRAKKDILLRK